MIADTGGRPLGLAVARDGRLLICDSQRDTGDLGCRGVRPGADVLLQCRRIIRRHNFSPKSTSRFHYGYYKGVVAFDPDDGHVVTQLRTQHADFGLATGVVETPGRLWLGRIGGAGVCYLDL